MRSIIAQTKKRDKDNAELLIYYNTEKILGYKSPLQRSVASKYIKLH